MQSTTASANAGTMFDDIKKIRSTRPRIHNITNFFVTNTTVNALLFIGASPNPSFLTKDVDSVHTSQNAISSAKQLAKKYQCAVVVSGATNYRVEDILFQSCNGEFKSYHAKRLNTKNKHGTGCTLSSAIAAELGKGLRLDEAAHRAKVYINGVISFGSRYRLGKGQEPLIHHYMNLK